jgi:hypothetical protein
MDDEYNVNVKMRILRTIVVKTRNEKGKTVLNEMNA